MLAHSADACCWTVSRVGAFMELTEDRQYGQVDIVITPTFRTSSQLFCTQDNFHIKKAKRKTAMTVVAPLSNRLTALV